MDKSLVKKKGFIPPVCPDVHVDVSEAISSVYLCLYSYIYVCMCICICSQ